jgi:hypothetical protein
MQKYSACVCVSFFTSLASEPAQVVFYVLDHAGLVCLFNTQDCSQAKSSHAMTRRAGICPANAPGIMSYMPANSLVLALA